MFARLAPRARAGLLRIARPQQQQQWSSASMAQVQSSPAWRQSLGACRVFASRPALRGLSSAAAASPPEHQEDLERIKELEQELESLKSTVHDIDSQPSNFFIDNLPWTPASRRVGVVGKKMGMLSIWDQHGTQFPVTVIAVPDCQVLNPNLTPDKQGLVGLQVAADNMKPKNCTKSLLTVFRSTGMPPKRRVVEFRVTPDALLPRGYPIDVRHFLPGQYVDIQGRT